MTRNGGTAGIGPGPGEVDRAVRSVLADWLSVPKPSTPQARRVGLDGYAPHLLSLKRAEALPSGLRTLQVAPRTVITPLARDYLKHRGINIQYVSKGEVDRFRNRGEWGFAIESFSGLMEAFRRTLLAETETWHELGPSLEQVTTWLTRSEGRGVMFLSDEASVTVFRACQTPGVRAAAAWELESVARAVRLLGANLIVVEPAGKSLAFLKQVGTTFRRAGGPVPPFWIAQGLVS